MNIKTYVHRSAAAVAAGLVLLAGCQKKEEPPPPPAPAPTPAKPKIISAEKNSFDAVTAKLDPGGNLYLYWSTENILSKMSENLASASNLIASLPDFPGTGRQTLDQVFTVLDDVVKASGLNQISGLGMSSIAREKGFYYNKVVLHHYAGQNHGLIWSLFGQSPHPLNVLDFLPTNTALASSTDFDLPLAWTNIMHELKALDLPEVGPVLEQIPGKYFQETGLELDATLHSLGGEYGLILTLDTNKSITLPLRDHPITIPSPGLCLIFKVNSDLIFDRLDQFINSNALLKTMVVRTDEPGLKMRTVPIPGLPGELHPTVARMGDYLLVSSSDNLVREMLAVKDGKKKGFKSTDTYKRLAQGVPEMGNNFSLATSALASTLSQVQEKALTEQKMDPAAIKNMQQMFQNGTNFGSFSVGVNGPDGWEGVGNSGVEGAQTMAVPTVAVAGAVAGMVIPELVRSATAGGTRVYEPPQLRNQSRLK